MRTPDALLLPESWKSGRTHLDRIDSILAIAEPLLGVDRAEGRKAYIRRQPGGRLFVTADPKDTLCFPLSHAREGMPRYRWVVQEDGSEHGFLVEHAHDA
jgi:hypothetical protein